MSESLDKGGQMTSDGSKFFCVASFHNIYVQKKEVWKTELHFCHPYSLEIHGNAYKKSEIS